jgi:hypothetical protein
MSDLSHISSSKLEIEASALWREINLPNAHLWAERYAQAREELAAITAEQKRRKEIEQGRIAA